MFILAQRFLTFNSCHFNIITFLYFIEISESSLFKSKKTILLSHQNRIIFKKYSLLLMMYVDDRP